MKLVIVSVLTATLAVLAGTAHAEPPEGVAIPVPRWAARPSNPPVFGPPDVFGPEDGPGSYADDMPRGPWDETADGLVRLLDESVRAAGGALEEADEGTLVVSGPDAARRLASAHVDAVRRFLEQRSTISVQLVALPPDAPPARSTDDIASLLADAPERLVFAARFALRRGERSGRDELTDQRFVMSHDPEVAQAAAISEPIVGRLRTGRRVHVSARPLSNDAAAISLSVGLSHSPGRMGTTETATGTLDLPETPFLSLTTDLRLEVGDSEILVVGNPLSDGSALLGS